MFDTIIGNPPYQSESSSILYDKYILDIKKLKPTVFSFVVPSNWITGNASSFKEIRKYLLANKHLRVLHDYVNASDVFPIKLDCGVCYFLYNSRYNGKCLTVTNLLGGSFTSERILDSKSPVRFAKAASIISKVAAKDFSSFSSLVKPNPFQIDKTRIGRDTKNTVTLYKSYKRIANIPIDAVTKGKQYVNSWKIFISKVYGDLDFPRRILPNPIIGKPGSVCSQSYLFIGPFDSETEAANIVSYMKTRFFRFLTLMLKSQQFIRPATFSHVPMQDVVEYDGVTDKQLYCKYGLTDDEISFIKMLIRPMGKGKDFKIEQV